MGPLNKLGTEFISDIGHRTTRLTDDPRESAFLFQRISVAIQRFNSVCFPIVLSYSLVILSTRQHLDIFNVDSISKPLGMKYKG